MAFTSSNSSDYSPTKLSTKLPIMTISQIETIILSSVNVIGALIGAFGNILVFMVVAKCRYLGWQKTEYFICSLAGSDLLVCLLAQPLYITHLNNLLPSNINTIRQAVTWIATLASVSSLLTISIDRFLALLFLRSYRSKMTTKTALILVALSWVFSLVNGISASALHRTFRFVSQYFVIAVLVIMPLLYIGVFVIVRVQCTEMKRQFPTRAHKLRAFTREKTVAKLIGVVVGVFYICYLPLIVLPFFNKSPVLKKFTLRVFPWVNTLALCNSCINPYIYYWRSWRFRGAIQNMSLGKTIIRLRSKKISGIAENQI